MRKHLVRIGFTALRLGITVGLLWLLVSRIDLNHMRDALTGAKLTDFALSVVLLAAINIFIAWRWLEILKIMDRPLGYWALFRLMFVGLFFNQILPTGVGGDALRAWGCHKLGPPLGVAVRSVLIDRVLGCAALLLLSVASLPIILKAVTPLQQQGLVALTAAGLCGLAIFFFVDRLPMAWLRFRFAVHLAQLSKNGRCIFANGRNIAKIFMLSMAGLVLIVLATESAGRSVGIELTTLQWLAILPPTMLIQLVPISIGGWGVRETVLVVLLGAFGVPEGTAFAASVLVGLGQIIISLPGALIWLHAPEKPHEADSSPSCVREGRKS